MFNDLSAWNIFIILLWVVMIGWIIYEVIQYFRRRDAATALTNEEFKENIRKAQVIDLREKDDFKKGHILGARNIPYTMLKQRVVELRKDQPVYLYEDGKMLSLRAGLILRKNNFDKNQVFYLKEGFKKWDGRVK